MASVTGTRGSGRSSNVRASKKTERTSWYIFQPTARLWFRIISGMRAHEPGRFQ